MLELPTILRLIKEAHFNYFEIITGAHWTANESLMRRTLDQVQHAISERKDKSGDFDFSFRISLDSFHQAVVKLHWLKSLVDVVRKDAVLSTETRKYPDINLFFRALLIEDDTVDQFVNLLNINLGEMNDYVRELRFDDKFSTGINTLKIFYKDMRFVGRGKTVKTVKLMEFDQYFSSYADKNQDVRLGMTYLKAGSRGEVLDGINVFVTYEGKMLPYGGVSDVFADIYTDSYADFLSKLSRDIISRTLLQKGLMGVMKIAEEVDPSIGGRVRRKNWIASVADESLATPELRLYITLRLLQEYVKESIVELESLVPQLRDLVTTDISILQNEYKRQVQSARKHEYSFGNEVVVYSGENELAA